MQTCHVRYVHKVSPRDTDTTEVCLPDNAFSDRKTLGKALRKAGVMVSGTYIREMRTEGDKVILFPICPGLTTYWHAIVLTLEAS